MINRIQIREMLAWTALVLAILILGFSVSFAQSKSVEVINKNEKAPTLEKIVSGKNGKQLFVFKRSEFQKK